MLKEGRTQLYIQAKKFMAQQIHNLLLSNLSFKKIGINITHIYIYINLVLNHFHASDYIYIIYYILSDYVYIE